MSKEENLYSKGKKKKAMLTFRITVSQKSRYLDLLLNHV